ncbi:MAG: acyl-CoA dehydrogenase family protein [Draconibacterium sp.]|nr:acyl-CoA dehydrogenase family protein [Draconibacterium sp.]
MPNFFTDNPDIKFNLDRLDLKTLADIVENDYSSSKEHDFAPVDREEAAQNYLDILEVVGDICAGPIFERSRQIDEEGHVCENGDVTMNPLVLENMDDFKEMNLMGISLPYKYGGLNMPQTVKIAIIEMVSRADASLMTMVGLQDIAETIEDFGSELQKKKYIPSLAAGDATGAMVLTEPDFGSDLQSVKATATAPEDGDENGLWRLNGTKRFITNGNGTTLLVLARSEKGTSDGRGLSMFVCQKDETINIDRIEEKLGIHGSPTCEMTFNNTPAYLVGKRKFGLIKYIMSLMNGARIAVAAQALGIAEAAYNLAKEYAEERVQFNKPIIKIPAVYKMLTEMRLNIEAGRLLLYETGKVVDHLKANTKNPDADRKETKHFERLAAVLTPFSKYYNAEMSNSTAYDGLQVMGGNGYMKDYDMERYYRDARITNIYEGTSQLQVVAAIGGILSGVLDKELAKFSESVYPVSLENVSASIKSMLTDFNKAVEFVRQQKDHEYVEYISETIVKMGLDVYISTLFIDAAQKDERKAKLAEIWVNQAQIKTKESAGFVLSGERNIVDNHSDIII